jgi:hypothetical protein
MRTYKPKQQKAIWYRAIHGDERAPRRVCRIRPVSKSLARERRVFAREVKTWLQGRVCICDVLRDASGNPICDPKPHPATDPHHKRGRVGPLLRDFRFIVPVCRKAHDWVKNHPAEAETLGLIQGPWNHLPKEAK